MRRTGAIVLLLGFLALVFAPGWWGVGAALAALAVALVLDLILHGDLRKTISELVWRLFNRNQGWVMLAAMVLSLAVRWLDDYVGGPPSLAYAIAFVFVGNIYCVIGGHVLWDKENPR